MINIVFQYISFIELDVSYASLHTFSKVTVAISLKTIYIYRAKNSMPRDIYRIHFHIRSNGGIMTGIKSISSEEIRKLKLHYPRMRI